MTHPHLCTLLALLLAAPPATAQEPGDPASALPPDAQLHNSRGLSAFLARDLDTALAELQQAYAAMPDPVAHRKGRDLVLSSLRGVHLERYRQSGARADLCAARELQRAHLDALRTSLGPSARPDDLAGPQKGLDELDARLARDFPGAPRCAAPIVPPAPAPQRPAVTAPRPDPAPLRPTDPTSRQARGGGGALIGVAGLAAIGSVSAAAIYGDRYDRLDALAREIRTPEQLAEIDRLHHQGRVARTTAVVLGSAAGLLLVAGIAVLVSAPRRPTRVRATPSLTPTAWGLHIHGRF